jgi:acetyl-CoA synthetase (ADP-forming)
LEFFKDDPQTSVIGLYIEEIKRGREFIKLAREITPYKPIVAIYAGGSEAAERSIMSHTGSIGGNQRIYDAVFKETGIIATDSILDFLYYLRTLSFSAIDNIYPKGNRIGIITDSGGAGSMMTKNCELLGLTVPEFSKLTQEKIKKLIPYTASPKNPIDVTFDMNQYNLYVNMPKLLMKSGEVDGIIVYGIFDFHEVYRTMEESGVDVSEGAAMLDVLDRVFLKPLKRICKKLGFPVFLVGPQLYSYQWYQKILEFNMNIFDFWDYPSKCMSILMKYSSYCHDHDKKSL